MLLRFSFGVLLLGVQNALAQPIDPRMKLLRNDKEVRINAFAADEARALRLSDYDGNKSKALNRIFLLTLQTWMDDDGKGCELDLIPRLQSAFKDARFNYGEEDLKKHFKLLRSRQYIDDIFLTQMLAIIEDYFALRKVDIKDKPGTSGKEEDLLAHNDLKELFTDFRRWPDEYKVCSYKAYYELRSKIRGEDGKLDKDGDELMTLAKKAYNSGLMTLTSYRRLEFLHEDSNIDERKIWLNDYLNIIFKAKNKLKPVTYDYELINIGKENGYSQEHYKRWTKIGRRQRLYEKYNETQILMLAQVLQKASRRMGVDPDVVTHAPVITQEFEITKEAGAEPENYIERLELDVQSQYNLARRRMRKDILELQMMDTFNKITITYEDVVMAGFETGYVSFEQIDFVLKYDDLWNKKKSFAEKMVNFSFTVAGFSTFFLPTPFNVIGSITLGIADGIIENKFFSEGKDNDNANTFIE